MVILIILGLIFIVLVVAITLWSLNDDIQSSQQLLLNKNEFYLEEDYVKRHAQIRGIEPRPASYAFGYINVEGIAGSLLPQNLQFSTPLGTFVTSLEPKTIAPNGQVKIRVRSTLIGFSR